jgi:hypothetical protein
MGSTADLITAGSNIIPLSKRLEYTHYSDINAYSVNSNLLVGYDFKSSNSLLLDNGPYAKSLVNYGGIYAMNSNMNSLLLGSSNYATFAEDNWLLNSNISISGWFKSSGFQDGDEILDFTYQNIEHPNVSPYTPAIQVNKNEYYVTFTNVGTNTIFFPKNTKCDILVVGGGGGGGGDMGGGGGAGGVVFQKGVSVSRGTYTITVGAGGAARAASAANTNNSVNGNDGTASSIAITGGSVLTLNGITYQANGGGGGANYNVNTSTNGNTGGSGGGGTNKNDDSITSGGAASQGNTLYILNSATSLAGGYTGSDGQRGNGWMAGGGGGAGGTSGSAHGGSGVQIDITGQNAWYAAGGGGGVIGDSSTSSIGATTGGKGGSGIGGNGNFIRFTDNLTNYYLQDSKHDGTNGTGAGGGGGARNYGPTLMLNNGGAGGSGIVIIRYTVDTNYSTSFFNNTTNLEAWYKFDGGNTNMLLDSSGKGRSLTNNGATFDSNNCRTGSGSVYLNGSSQYLDINSSINPYTIWNSGGGGITFSVWFKMSTSSGAWTRIFSFSDGAVGSNPTNQIVFYRNGTNNTIYIQFATVSNAGQYLSTANWVDNNWHHMVWSISSSGNWTIYMDNVNLNVNINAVVSNITWTRRYIGRSSVATDGWYVGNIDDFRIYNKVLSADEVNILYNIGYNIVLKRLNNNLSFELNNTSVYNVPYVDNVWNQFIWNIENVGSQGFVKLNNGSKNYYNKVLAQSPLIRNYPIASLGSATGTSTDSSTVLSAQTHGNGLYRITASSSVGAMASYGAHLAFNKASPSGEAFWGSAATYSTSTTFYTGTVSTTYNTNLTYLGEWLQIQLPQNIVLTSYTLVGQVNTSTTGVAGRSPKNFIILGSSNGINWALVDTETNITGWANLGAVRTFTTNNVNQAYSYYRICINANQGDATYGSSVSIAEWELFGYIPNTYVYNNMMGSVVNKGSLYLADIKVLTNTYSDAIIENASYGIAPNSYHVNYQFKNQASLLADDGVYNRTLTNSGGVYALNDSRNSIYLTANTEAFIPNQNWSLNVDLTLSCWFKTNLFENGDKLIDFNVNYNHAFFLETNDIIAWYKFDDNYNDSSGNNRTLTETGIFSYSTDTKVGTKSINQQNTNSTSYLANPNVNICTSLSDQAFSISFWINFAAFGTLTYRVIGFGNEQLNYKSLHIGLVNSGFRFSFWGVLFEQTYSSTDILNKWVHFVCTYSNRTQKIYKDGVFVKQLTVATDPIFNPGHFRIGSSATGGNPSFIGKLDDVRIYKREITTTEINILYTWNTNYIHNIVIKNNDNKLALQVNDTSIYDTPFVQNRWYYLAWNLSSTISSLGYVQLNDKKVVTNKAIFTNSYSPYLYTNKLGSSTNKGNVYMSDFKILTTPITTAVQNSLYSSEIVLKNKNMTNNIQYYANSKINSYLHYKFQSPALLTIDSSLNNRVLNNNGGVYALDSDKNSILLETGDDASFANANWSTFSDLSISGWFKTNNLQNGDILLQFEASTTFSTQRFPRYFATANTYTYPDGTIVRTGGSTYFTGNGNNYFYVFDYDYTWGWASQTGTYNKTTGLALTTYMTGYVGEYVQIDLGEQVLLEYYKIFTHSDLLFRAPKVFRLYASNDVNCWTNINHSSWVMIDERNLSSTYANITLPISSNTTPYRFFVLIIKNIFGNNIYADMVHFAEIELWGTKPKITKSIKIHREVDNLIFQIDNTPVYSTPSFANSTWTHILWNIVNSSANGFVRLSTSSLGTENTYAKVIPTSGSYTNKLGSITNVSSINISDFRIITEHLTPEIKNKLYSSELVDTGYIDNVAKNMTIHQNRIQYYNASSKINSYIHYAFQSPALLTIDSSLNNRLLNNNGGIYNVDYGKNNLLLKTGYDATIPSANWSTFTDLSISGWFKTDNLQNGDKLLEFSYNEEPDFVNDTTNLMAWYKFENNWNTSATSIATYNLINDATNPALFDANLKVRDTYSAFFDNTNDFLSNTTINLNNTDYSIAFWVRLTGLTNNSTERFIVSQGTTGVTRSTLHIGWRNNYWLFGLFGDDCNSSTMDYTTVNNTWVHMVFTFDYVSGGNNVFKIFMNGTLIGSKNTTSGTTNFATGTWRIGKTANLSFTGFTGYLDDFRIYNRVLTDTEISQIYTYTNLVQPFTSSPSIVPVQIGSTNDYYVAFTSTSVYTVTFTRDTVCDILVVGGGGGGGQTLGGGGGGGAVVYATGANITTGTYSINVGTGGTGDTTNTYGVKGGNSSFAGIIAEGGGASSTFGDNSNGMIGGCGGGAGGDSSNGMPIPAGGAKGTSSTLNGFLGTIYGNKGGDVQPRNGNFLAGGGGGGAGEVGGTGIVAAATDFSGNGGNGIQINIDGRNFYWGGGGGGSCFQWGSNKGGNGGLGGGGGGAYGNANNGGIIGTSGTGGGSALNSGSTPTNTNGGNGGANTGGGGGGCGWSPAPTAGGSGGSGIVIIRYSLAQNIVIKKVSNNLSFQINNMPIYSTPSFANNTWTHILWNIISSSPNAFVRLSTTSQGIEQNYTKRTIASLMYTNKLGSITNIGSLNVSDFRIITEPLTFEIKNRLYSSEPTYSSFVDTGFVDNVVKNMDSLYYNSTKEVEANANGITVYGNLTATNDIVPSYSDMRLKQVVSYIDNPLDKIMQIQTFKYLPSELARTLNINDNKVRIGLSAQDVQKVLPEIVCLAPFDTSNLESGDIVSVSSSNYLSVSYERVVPLLVECLKELKRELTLYKQ